MTSPTSVTAVLCVAAGGAFGSALRYLFTVWLQPISRGFPTSILVVNVLGSFLITFVGAATTHGARHPLSEAWRLAVLVGVLGGFTTFSSFSLQTLDLLRAGLLARAAANVVLTVAACLLAAAVGYALGAKAGGV